MFSSIMKAEDGNEDNASGWSPGSFLFFRHIVMLALFADPSHSTRRLAGTNPSVG